MQHLSHITLRITCAIKATNIWDVLNVATVDGGIIVNGLIVQKIPNRPKIKIGDLKSDNLQYNTLGCWVNRLIDQASVADQKSTRYFFCQMAHSVFVVDKWSQQVHDLSIKIFNKAP